MTQSCAWAGTIERFREMTAMITDNLLLSFADECPWAVARLRRRHESALRAYLLDRVGSELLVGSCLFLVWWLLPQVSGEIREGESIADFLRLVADVSVNEFHSLHHRLAA